MSKQEILARQRNSDAPLPRIEERRWCRNCNTVLSSYNTDKRCLCLLCQSIEKRAMVERVGSKLMRERRPPNRELVLAPQANTIAPRIHGPINAQDLSNIVAYECGVRVEDLFSTRLSGYHNKQSARTIFVYLVYTDICKVLFYAPTAKLLNINPQCVHHAKSRIENQDPRPQVLCAIKRIRAYYKSAMQAAA